MEKTILYFINLLGFKNIVYFSLCIKNLEKGLVNILN
jgi:hypothetical protein